MLADLFLSLPEAALWATILTFVLGVLQTLAKLWVALTQRSQKDDSYCGPIESDRRNPMEQSSRDNDGASH